MSEITNKKEKYQVTNIKTNSKVQKITIHKDQVLS